MIWHGMDDDDDDDNDYDMTYNLNNLLYYPYLVTCATHHTVQMIIIIL